MFWKEEENLNGDEWPRNAVWVFFLILGFSRAFRYSYGVDKFGIDFFSIFAICLLWEL